MDRPWVSGSPQADHTVRLSSSAVDALLSVRYTSCIELFADDACQSALPGDGQDRKRSYWQPVLTEAKGGFDGRFPVRSRTSILPEAARRPGQAPAPLAPSQGRGQRRR